MTSSSSPIRIAQLSDTHFLEAGHEPEGGFAYDTSDAFDAVYDHVATHDPFDLIVVTGDVADHGRAAQYQMAAEAFSRFTVPVNACPGNHDQALAFTTSLGRPGVSMSRAIEVGNWCFLFVDSNAGVMLPDAEGRPVDPADYDDRLHRNGALGGREAGWIRDACAATAAEHVFVWLHHPPAPVAGLSDDAAYEAEWRELVPQLEKLRGFGGGHTHIPALYDFEDKPVHVAPSLKNNFDLDAGTMLPPGYRTYEFFNDGTVTSSAQLVDDDRWPRRPLGRAVMALMRGELSWDDFNAIVARKTAEAANT